MDETRITVRVDPPAEFWRPIEEGLRAFNESRVGALPRRRALALHAHDALGELMGALWAG